MTLPGTKFSERCSMIKTNTIKVSVPAISCFILVLCEFKPDKTLYFEGTVTYKYDVMSKNAQFDSVWLRSLIGHGSTLFFKEGNYMHRYLGGLTRYDLYRKEDNKVYSKLTGNDTLFWTDCSKPGDEVMKFSFTPKKENILGVLCDELIIYYKGRTITEYYNSDSLKINPVWFTNFLRDGQNLIDKKEKAIFLKQKVEYPDFKITITATAFSREPIDEIIFKLSAGEIVSQKD
jgi:hypothetical protein